MTTQLLLSLSILIAVHEWGHYITARMFNIKVEKFYLFFDFLFPMANVLNFSLLKFKKGDTEYGIGWFPLGGYVKIAGMVDESMDKDQLATPPQPWEFRTKPAWQRLIVMLGGIIVNVIVGVIIFISMTYFLGDTYVTKDYVNSHGGIHALELGKQIGFQTGDQIIKINGKDFEDFGDVADPDILLSGGSFYTVLRNGAQVNIPIPGNFVENFNDKESASKFIGLRYPPIINDIQEKLIGKDSIEVESLAKKVGLHSGDQIVEFNGQPIQYFDQVTDAIAGLKDESGNVLPGKDSVTLKVKRPDLTIASFSGVLAGGSIGFYAKPEIKEEDLAVIKYGFGESVSLGAQRAFGVVFVQVKAMKKIVTGQMSLKKSLSGPIGLAHAYGSEWDMTRFWRMTGLLSMVLAFMNLLPIPGLDGGYVMFLLYEMASGRQPSEKFFETALKIGMAFLLLLMVFVFYNDIVKLFAK